MAIDLRRAPDEVRGAVGDRRRAVEDRLEVDELLDLHAVAARELGVVRLGTPVVAPAGGIGGARERDAEHDGIRSHRQCLDDVAGRADAAVGDDVHVASARLVEVVAARAGDVGDGGRHRGVDAERRAGRGRRSPAEADEHAGGAGAHEVQRRRVGRGAADDDRDVQVVDELLEVERLRRPTRRARPRPSCRG